MIAFINDIDRILQAAPSRYGMAYARSLQLSASARAFEVALDATVSPEAIIFIASRVGFSGGTVEFSTNNGTPLTVDGDVATLMPAAMMGPGCEVIATVTYQGEPHVARQSVIKTLAFDASIPPAPGGLKATSALASIQLSWAPTNNTNIGKVEVWRALEDSRATAVPVGSTTGLGLSFVDNIGAGGTFHYWIRYVSKANVVGPFNALSGTLGSAGNDPAHLHDLLKESISESLLVAALRSRIDLVDAEGTGLVDRVGALVVTYGETASAAESAVLATQARMDAVQAKVQAEGASQAAVDAKVAALRAQATAEEQAGASEQSRLAAESAQQGAQTSASASVEAKQAAESAATNAGAAANASTEERLAAQAAAGVAGTRSSAASTSAGQAAGFADSAGSSAYAANQLRIAAEAAAAGAAGEAGASAESARQAAASATSAGSAATAAEQSRLAADSANSQAGTKAGAAATSATQASSFADAASASAGASQQSRLASESAKEGASGSASAAATSRSDANTSASNAAQSAASASASANTASTKAGEATSAASRAATSESNAAGSASSASTSATNAANSANSIGGSAQAAAGSASSASTSATNAGNSATAANAARVAAESARDAAAGLANAASTSASTASTKAGDAGWHANAASLSANTANTAAGAALSYRDSAAQSVVDAQGFANASARDYTAVNARLNNYGGSGVTVEQKIEASANSITGLRGQMTVKLDVNGYVSGYGLASTSINDVNSSAFAVLADSFRIGIPGYGAVRMFYVDASGAYMDKAFIRELEVSKITSGTMNAEWRMTGPNARIVLDTGSVMKVIGTGFGANRDLIEWFGPSMAVSQCSKANATTYEALDGSAYHGGALRAGTLYNAQRTTQIAASAEVPLGPFHSNGNVKTVVVSYTYGQFMQAQEMGGSGFVYQGGATFADIQLLRSFNGGPYALVSSFRATGSYSIMNENDGPDSAEISMGGSVTYTDSGGAGSYTYIARIAGRSAAAIGHTSGSISGSSVNQSLGIVSTEQ